MGADIYFVDYSSVKIYQNLNVKIAEKKFLKEVYR